jgi:hypothetical protein
MKKIIKNILTYCVLLTPLLSSCSTIGARTVALSSGEQGHELQCRPLESCHQQARKICRKKTYRVHHSFSTTALQRVLNPEFKMLVECLRPETASNICGEKGVQCALSN